MLLEKKTKIGTFQSIYNMLKKNFKLPIANISIIKFQNFIFLYFIISKC